jgi:hypothetical protein
MGMEKNQRVVTEALVLAFAHSEAKLLVGTDALRSIIEVRYRDLTQSGAFDLADVLDLLASQPGYTEEPVASALLRFHAWEDQLGLPIKLPPSITALAAERPNLIDACSVPASELARVLRGETPSQALPPVVREAPRPAAPRSASAPRFAMPSGGVLALAAVGLLGLGFAGWYAYTRLGDPAPQGETLSARLVPGVPLASVERFGGSVVAVLDKDGDAWLAGPATRRTRQLEEAFAALPTGTTALVIKDAAGAIRATVQQGPDGRPQTRFE